MIVGEYNELFDERDNREKIKTISQKMVFIYD